MKKRIWEKNLVLTTLFLLLTLVFLIPETQMTTLAASKNVEITGCRINTANKRQLIVQAKVKKKTPDTDGKYYLFHLAPYQSRISVRSRPAATARGSRSLSFRTDLNKDSSGSKLYDKFVIAVKKKSGAYVAVSGFSYITNPDAAAKYRYTFPKASSKKGLQISPSMMSDVEDLGVKHATVNIVLDTLMPSEGQKNASDSYAYRYQGKTYWFLRSGTAGVDSIVRSLTRNNVVVTGILLLQGLEQASELVPPGLVNSGNAYFGLNTANRQGVETLSALMSFLGEHYMSSSKANGRICNWVLGNEVDNYSFYNYMGELSLNKYTELYARSFRVVSTALRSVYSNARVYVSLDHLWNEYQTGGRAFTAKSTLDGFVKAIKNEGSIPWHLAYHAYPQPLTDPVFWDDIGTNSSSTSYITMNNIKVLTDYVKKLNKNARVILSEQGFSSQSSAHGKDERLQAAAFAYAYYITEFNSQIDSLILMRHVDHEVEEDQGIFNGFWSNKNGCLEWADKQKQIWSVFKYIDTTSSRTITDFALKEIGISSWSRKISGFTWNRFSKMTTYQNGSLSLVKKSYQNKNLSTSWRDAYNALISQNKDKAEVKVDSTTNNNLYKGVGQSFRVPLNFSSRNILVFQILVSGTKAKDAAVRVRFFSGNHVYEASGEILTNRQQQFSASLSKWKYRKKVNRIQIWVRPFGDGAWYENGKITISGMKQATKMSRVYISGFKSSLKKGKTMRLRVVGGPGNVSWSSSKSSIAQVTSKGVVSAKKRGTVVIRAKSGSYTVMGVLKVE